VGEKRARTYDDLALSSDVGSHSSSNSSSSSAPAPAPAGTRSSQPQHQQQPSSAPAVFRFNYEEEDESKYFPEEARRAGEGEGEREEDDRSELGEMSLQLREARAVQKATKALLERLERSSVQLSRAEDPVVGRNLCELISSAVVALKHLKSLNQQHQ